MPEELFRKLLIDWALKNGNRDMFMKLTSEGWRKHVVARPKGKGRAMSDRFVFCKDEEGEPHLFNFGDSHVAAFFSVREEEYDIEGWRDRNGLTFRERLALAGCFASGLWVRMGKRKIEALEEEFRRLHPNEIVAMI